MKQRGAAGDRNLAADAEPWGANGAMALQRGIARRDVRIIRRIRGLSRHVPGNKSLSLCSVYLQQACAP